MEAEEVNEEQPMTVVEDDVQLDTSEIIKNRQIFVFEGKKYESYSVMVQAKNEWGMEEASH